MLCDLTVWTSALIPVQIYECVLEKVMYMQVVTMTHEHEYTPKSLHCISKKQLETHNDELPSKRL